MINFRYHVVSLVAVFLALALGMIMGSTVIDDRTVSQLSRDLRDFRNSNGRLRADVDALEERLGFYERFGEALLPSFVTGRLAGRTAVVLIQDGANGKAVDGVLDALTLSGAVKPARIRLTGNWIIEDDEMRGKLAVASGIAVGDQESVLEGAGSALGARLATGGDRTAENDMLARLGRAGFVRIDDAADGTFPPAGSMVIVVPSGLRGAGPRQDSFYPALLRALSGKRTIAVYEPLGAEESLAGRVIGDGELSKSVATVDHGDTAAGVLSLVWALRDLADGRPATHYGVRRGTLGVIPDLGAR